MIILLFIAAAASAPASERVIDPDKIEPWKVSWSLNLEGGLGVRFPGTQFTGMGRVRPGVVVWRYPLYIFAGPTYEISPLALASFGVQGEVLHLGWGIWGQLGGAVSTTGWVSAHASAGFSIVGLEAQFVSPTHVQLFAKLRIQVDFILAALTR